jgi:polysaccharide biosynthesis/export protein
MKNARIAALAAALVLFGDALAAQEVEYQVGPGDVLSISVWKQPDLSGRFTVGDDGFVPMPMLGRLNVGGLTRSAIESNLRSSLAAGYLRDPQVTVAIDQYRSQRVFVTGEVRQPGTITMSGPLSLLEALARAGSTTQQAGLQAIIARPSGTIPTLGATPLNGGSEIIRVDLNALQNGNLAQNVQLREGDTIFVPRAGTVHILGEVRSPGEYPVFPTTRVAELLSRAGGITDRGAMSHIRISRVVNGKKREMKAGLDDHLQPGDIVVVREGIF